MMDTVEVTRETDRSAVCERCLVADRMTSRMRGLLGRRALAPGDGMVIRPAPSIHTFFMRFPIDAIFLARNGDVLKVANEVKPWRIRSARNAHAVLELAAGEAKVRNVSTGDRLVFGEAES
jgi:uncharacterized membrane protein (UPF0127 family)